MSLLTYFKNDKSEKQSRKRKLDSDDADAIEAPPSKRLRVAKKTETDDHKSNSDNEEEKEVSAPYVSDDGSEEQGVSTSASTAATPDADTKKDAKEAQAEVEGDEEEKEKEKEEEKEEEEEVTYANCHLLLDESWKKHLSNEFKKSYFKQLQRHLKKEEESGAEIFPPVNQVYRAFELCKWDNLKVVILGQDPYHDNGQAEGLCFSVAPGIKLPSSLRNMYKEATSDFGFKAPGHGSLVHWGEQGVLLLNTALTVRAHKANSHAKWGWQEFTDAVIKAVSRKHDGVVFILWGKQAQKKAVMIDKKKHRIVQSAHPSGLSASRGFYGSKPYSKSNALLEQLGKEPIDWQIPPLE